MASPTTSSPTVTDSSAAADHPVVSTRLGAIRGRSVEGVAVFSGIRFAVAERFGAPRSVEPWDGELDATGTGNQCPQVFGMLDQALGMAEAPVSEDCLFLTVATPTVDDAGAAPVDARHPVIVWIHGGGFTSGSGTMPWYDGGNLVRRGGVVVVTINYRLGAFGFTGRTNCGVQDQIAALRWVRDHIAAFGGDADDVTIVGESAGGASVVALLAAPSARGLFHRAMAMSPSINQLRSGQRADAALRDLAAAAGVASLDELREISTEELLRAQQVLVADRDGWITAFSPCADGELFPGPLVEAAAESAVPLLIGTTRDEMNLFSVFDPATASMTDDQLRRRADPWFGDRVHEAIGAYRVARPEATTPGAIATAMATDEAFRVPARRLAEARVGSGHDTWMYWFTWATPAFGGMLGSCHAVDIPFLFDQLDQPTVRQFTGDSSGRAAVADAYAGSLLSFVATGDPGWPPFDLERRATMRIDETTELLHDPEADLRDLW